MLLCLCVGAVIFGNLGSLLSRQAVRSSYLQIFWVVFPSDTILFPTKPDEYPNPRLAESFAREVK